MDGIVSYGFTTNLQGDEGVTGGMAEMKNPEIQVKQPSDFGFKNQALFTIRDNLLYLYSSPDKNSFKPIIKDYLRNLLSIYMGDRGRVLNHEGKEEDSGYNDSFL